MLVFGVLRRKGVKKGSEMTIDVLCGGEKVVVPAIGESASIKTDAVGTAT